MKLPKNAARPIGTLILSKSSKRPRKIRQIHKHSPLLKLIEHFNDNSPTTQHLIESLAEETYSLHRSRTTET